MRFAWMMLLVCACRQPAEPGEEIRAEEFASDELEGRLDSASDQVTARGFTMVEDMWRGFLIDRGTSVHEVELRSGRCHVFVAVGSEAIESFDITVFDSDGSEAHQSDGVNAIRFCAPQSGVYFVTLSPTGSGLFSVRLFSGPPGLDARLDDLATGEL